MKKNNQLQYKKNFVLVARPYGINCGMFEVTSDDKKFVISGLVGDLIQKHIGDKTCIIKIQVEMVK